MHSNPSSDRIKPYFCQPLFFNKTCVFCNISTTVFLNLVKLGRLTISGTHNGGVNRSVATSSRFHRWPLAITFNCYDIWTNALKTVISYRILSFRSSLTKFIFPICPRSPYVEMNQTVGTAIITAPFYFILGYFGFSAGHTGSNQRLVTFLCLSIFCTLAAFLEGGGPCVSLANANPGMWLPERKICTPDPRYYWGHDSLIMNNNKDWRTAGD